MFEHDRELAPLFTGGGKLAEFLRNVIFNALKSTAPNRLKRNVAGAGLGLPRADRSRLGPMLIDKADLRGGTLNEITAGRAVSSLRTGLAR